MITLDRIKCFVGWHAWRYTRRVTPYDAFPAVEDRAWTAPCRICNICEQRQQWLPGYGGSEMGCWLTTPHPKGSDREKT